MAEAKQQSTAKKSEKSEKPENLNQGHRSRMRNRYLTCGFSGFQEHEILELLLFYALPRVNTNPIAHRLLNEFHSLAGVMDANAEDLQKIQGVKEQAAVFLKMIPELFRYYQLSKEQEEAGRFQWDMKQKAEMKKHLRNLYADAVREKVAVILLDNSMQIIEESFLAEGSANMVSVSVRSIVEMALRKNAVYVLLAHNHPSGTARPSQEDMYFTQQLYHALRYLNITLVDHYILGTDLILSLRDHGFWGTLE